ncbi:Urea transporter [Trinorchestia longiramus]|nr:Urea transporter [Trinorchestia longiramus]
MGNRRNLQAPKWLGWFGDMNVIRSFLFTKPWLSPWFPVKLINAVVRSFGVVAFANNPLTGLLIVAAMFIGDSAVAGVALMTTSIAVICSKVGNP